MDTKKCGPIPPCVKVREFELIFALSKLLKTGVATKQDILKKVVVTLCFDIKMAFRGRSTPP